MRKLVLLINLVIGLTTHAQNYMVIEPVASFTKTTDFATLHDQISITNLETYDFPMVWESYFDGKNGCPSGWQIFLNDPDSLYDPLNDGDSSSFVLSTTDTVMNKLIIGINHNDSVGSCFIGFTIYPLNNPSDTTNVGFDVTVVQGNGGWSSIIDQTSAEKVNTYPNPSTGVVKLDGDFTEVRVFDINGTLVDYQLKSSMDTYVFSLASGEYVIETMDNELNKKSSIVIIK